MNYNEFMAEAYLECCEKEIPLPDELWDWMDIYVEGDIEWRRRLEASKFGSRLHEQENTRPSSPISGDASGVEPAIVEVLYKLAGLGRSMRVQVLVEEITNG